MKAKIFVVTSVCLALLSVITIVVLAQGITPKTQATTTLTSISHSWGQVNENGFGYPANTHVLALAIFNNQLYAGAKNYSEGAQIWRSGDGFSWTQVSEARFGDTYTTTNPSIPDMITYKDKLYAGTGWSGTPGQIWRSMNGTTWEQVEANGFGSSSNIAIAAFGIFSDTLYVSTHDNSGLEIRRTDTGDIGDWVQIVTGGNGNTNNALVTSFIEFKGRFYAAVENSGDDGAEIWRTSNGTTWSAVATGGFGSTENTQTGGFAIFGDALYIGTRNHTTGGQIWKSIDGTTWTQVISDGFGDTNNLKVESLHEYDGAIYAGTDNITTGVEVWRSYDGTTWEQANADGFGNANTISTLWASSTITFNENLYIGADNPDEGGQVWMLLRQIFLPLVIR